MNTAPVALTLQELANVALGILGRDSEPVSEVARTGQSGWRAGSDDGNLDIRLAGPDIPAALNEEVIPAPNVPEDMSWTGTYRLIVRAPLIVFDIAWTPGEPLRIMSFSRGDWEKELVRLSG